MRNCWEWESLKIIPFSRKSSKSFLISLHSLSQKEWVLIEVSCACVVNSPAAKMLEERALHESKLQKMESEMKMVFQQKVNEKEAKLKQSEEELYARHREMKEALEKQRIELEEKKRRLESGRPLTPEKVSVLSVAESSLM